MEKTDNTPIEIKETPIREMFEAGAHLGYSKSRRHPSVRDFIFGYKNKSAILDLEKSSKSLEVAKEFVKELGKAKKQILIVGNKNEAHKAVMKYADIIDMPYVAERWIGGTLTNASEIKKRLQRLAEIKADEESGTLEKKYKKKERGMIGKEKKDLERYFGGITEMAKLPSALVLIDSRTEDTALREAKKMKIPVVSLSNSDCDIRNIDYPVVANDSSVKSIEYFLSQIAESYKEGKKEAPAVPDKEATDAEPKK